MKREKREYDMTEEEKVLSYLEDEESRFIFEKRTEYNKSGKESCIADIVDKYLPEFQGQVYHQEMINEMIELLRDKKSIVLMGGGMRGVRLIGMFVSMGIKIKAIIDNDEKKQGTKVEDIPVISPKDINLNSIDCLVITPMKQEIINQLYAQAVESGIEKNCIIKYRDYCSSRLDEKQYFDEKIIHFEQQEVFCDVGAHDLDTSLKFYQKCIKEGTKKIKIYAFEPIPECFTRCRNLCEKHKNLNIELYNAALWNENTILHFVQDGGASHVSEEAQDLEVKALTLDNCISDDKVTFIKMDIEGSELKALQGAKETIRRDKPKLAICVYHKKEDLIQIPLFIKELVTEYKLYLRHYSNSPNETVLYAVI